MDIIWLYLFATFGFIVGAVLWLKTERITWQEWIAGSLLAFAVAGLFHLIAVFGATGDVETWSGHIVKAVHYPQWVEEYQQMHTRQVASGTDSQGNTTYSTEIYYTTEYRTHPEHWTAYSNIGTDIPITSAHYTEMTRVFHNRGVETPYKSGFYSGDRNVYPTYNRDRGEFYPITDVRSWQNKVRATPTTFSFPKVPSTVKVYEYPRNTNPWISDRLVGSAAVIDTLTFDRMNARLGPRKRVNVILVGFGNRDSMAAQWQEAAWIGGKKNDVVICWGGLNTKPTWVRAFGWTDSKTCLRDLESIALDKGVTTETLPLIEAEIVARYKLKDWDKAFAHVRVPAPMWAFWTYLAVTITGQTLFWWWANRNEFDKTSRSYRRSYSRYGY